MTRLSPLTINRRRRASTLLDIRIGWRAVGGERARKLRRRGEIVEWRPQLASMAWLPGGVAAETSHDHPAMRQFVMIMRCPGCGHLENSKTIESAGFDLDCPRCWLYNLSDFVPV